MTLLPASPKRLLMTALVPLCAAIGLALTWPPALRLWAAPADRSVPVLHVHADGTRVYHYKGLRHRADGPAVIRPDGSQEWWPRGRYVRRAQIRPD